MMAPWQLLVLCVAWAGVGAGGRPARSSIFMPLRLSGGYDAASAPAPHPWTRHWTDDGTPYYHNGMTGETVWSIEGAGAPAPPPAAVWTAYATEDGTPYYHNAAGRGR